MRPPNFDRAPLYHDGVGVGWVGYGVYDEWPSSCLWIAVWKENRGASSGMATDENEKIRERERQENAPHLAKARATGRPVTFIASDGCEVTVMPEGDIFYNVADWW